MEASSEYSELTKNGYEKAADGFADESAGALLSDFKKYKPYRPIARLYKGRDDTKYLYTFFMYDSYTKEDKTSGVLINFNSDYLLDSSENIDNSDSKYFIVDGNGVVVSNGSSLEMMKNYSDTSYIKSIISDPDKQGYFTDTIDGETMFFVYSKRDKLGWQYVSITKYETLLRSVNFIQMLTIVFSIVFVLVGVFVAFLITRWMYNPINEMEMDIKELKSEKRKAKNILQRVYVNDLLSSKESGNRDYLEDNFNKIKYEGRFFNKKPCTGINTN